jgi:hypothetical protein
MAKNICGKTRPKDKPYEIWRSLDGSWTWNVLKKWQADDDKPYARWFCNVVTPIMPNGEMGDVYVAEIKAQATLVWRDPAIEPIGSPPPGVKLPLLPGFVEKLRDS